VTVGVTVDIGWPWWASTTAALVVAIGFAVGFALVHDRLVRGVLAALAVQGALVAAAAPAVMDDSKGSMATGMSRDERLTRQEFAQSADERCRRLNEFWATTGNPKTLAGIDQQMDVLVPAVWQAWSDQTDLVPPEEEELVAMRWMGVMAAFARDIDAVGRAASRRDEPGVKAAYRRSGAHARESGQLSKQLGMQVCFQ
jgi:hypothetical protein